MKRVRYMVFVLLVLILGWPPAGWAVQESDSASAPQAPAARVGQDMGHAQKKEEAKGKDHEGGKGEGREEKCPVTFGPIISDTAVPIDTGKLSVQSTFGLTRPLTHGNDSRDRQHIKN